MNGLRTGVAQSERTSVNENAVGELRGREAAAAVAESEPEEEEVAAPVEVPAPIEEPTEEPAEPSIDVASLDQETPEVNIAEPVPFNPAPIVTSNEDEVNGLRTGVAQSERTSVNENAVGELRGREAAAAVAESEPEEEEVAAPVEVPAPIEEPTEEPAEQDANAANADTETPSTD